MPYVKSAAYSSANNKHKAAEQESYALGAMEGMQLKADSLQPQ